MGARSWRWTGARALVVLGLVFVPLAARADDPKFAYAEKPKDDAKPGGWKAEIKAGLLYLTGNSQSLSVSAAARASYDAVWQKYTFYGDYVYSRSTTLVSPDPGSTTPIPIQSLDDLGRSNNLSARLWDLGARFDQFLVHRNAQWDTSLYLGVLLGSDYSAGKKLFGDLQIGASTLLIKTAQHSLIGEGGFDFAFSDPYVDSTYFIFSLRLALNYTWAISKTSAFTAGVEWLTNLNQENAAYDDISNPNQVPVCADNRINAKVGLTTQIYDALSLGVTFVLRFDSAPSLAQLPSNVVAAPGVPGIFLYKTDTITTLQLVYTFGG